MEIRKGPYGHFIFERISSDTSIFNHSIEMINKGIPGIFLSTYIYDFRDYKEISYDVSDLVLINGIENYDTNTIRNAIGDLFLSFHKSLDLLLPLSNVFLSDEYLFISKDYKNIYIPYRPIDGDITLKLNSLSYKQIEKILSIPLFKDVLATDEINQLLFSIKNNDEQLFLNAANAIKKPVITKTKKKKGIIKYESLIVLLLFTVSVLSFFYIGLIPSLVLLLITILIALQLFLKNNKNTANNNNSTSLQETRTQILFKEESKSLGSENNCLFIESLEQVNGEFIKNAVYTPKAIIGSDCFLSDICIDDSNIAPLNAEITLKNNVYTLRKLTDRNNMLIENVVVSNDKEYELKSGQTITIGGIKLLIKIGFD